MSTPSMMEVDKPRRLEPLGGWKAHTYYVCRVAFSANNVIHNAIFYTGFLNGKNGGPGGYNGFVTQAGYEGEAPEYHEAFYVRPLVELMDREMRVINREVQVGKPNE